MHVIATAGHVDHGKSTLVRTMTGIDPDRLEEEKRRGLTIDLGFAWLRLPSGREVGIVDVPGHERFIRNMLAGVGAINVTLFTVAANEGWKPQSQEHLDILDLLDVSAAVIAVTKSDTVDAAALQVVIDDVRARIASTSLVGSPIVAISALKGSGLEQLVKEIEIVLDRTPPVADNNRPRLWIDRVFTMKGSGTVVTGTLIDGVLSQNQEVEVLPGVGRARIRSIQSHKKHVTEIGPGNRTALNLVGLGPERVTRGDVVSLAGLWRPTRRITCSIRFLSHQGFQPTSRGAFKFHTGSAERDAKLRFLGAAPSPGGEALALISLDQPVVVDWCDRFVLREAGRRMTVGGGVVLEPHPSQARSGTSGFLEGARRRMQAPDRAGYFDVLLDEEGLISQREIRVRTGLDPRDLSNVTGVWTKAWVWSEANFERRADALVDAIENHQTNHPLDAGVPRESARALLDTDSKAFDDLVEELVRRGRVYSDGDVVRTPDHSPALGGPDVDALMSELSAAGYSPPSTTELETRYDPALVRALLRSGTLVRIGDAVYSAGRVEALKANLARHIRTHGEITVAQFRDLIATTRKYAVPLLEHLDQVGFTQRNGDVRVLGSQARTGPGSSEDRAR